MHIVWSEIKVNTEKVLPNFKTDLNSIFCKRCLRILYPLGLF